MGNDDDVEKWQRWQRRGRRDLFAAHALSGFLCSHIPAGPEKAAEQALAYANALLEKIELYEKENEE